MYEIPSYFLVIGPIFQLFGIKPTVNMWSDIKPPSGWIVYDIAINGNKGTLLHDSYQYHNSTTSICLLYFINKHSYVPYL